MINETELIALEARAHALRLSMTEVCKLAGKHRQSWFRARKRGRAEYPFIRALESALEAFESEKAAWHIREGLGS